MGRSKKVLPNHAGLIDQRKCQKTKTTIGLYKALEAGIDSDPDLPYVTLCETHGGLVGHSSKAVAISWMSNPIWCVECQKLIFKHDFDRLIMETYNTK